MRRFIFATAAIATLAAGATMLNASAQAAIGDGLKPTIDGLNLIERADFIFGGHKHCWYGEGWHGAGWYWCGYAKRQGKGWGGEEGFHGWKH